MDAASNDGKTALYLAEDNGHAEIINILECYKSDLTSLPPEVYTDRKLIEVERQIGEGDYAAAALTMGFIACYSEKNDVALPTEFHFKNAQILQLAEDNKGALAAISAYLKEAGREGENYLAALQMLDELEK